MSALDEERKHPSAQMQSVKKWITSVPFEGSGHDKTTASTLNALGLEVRKRASKTVTIARTADIALLQREQDRVVAARAAPGAQQPQEPKDDSTSQNSTS